MASLRLVVAQRRLSATMKYVRLTCEESLLTAKSCDFGLCFQGVFTYCCTLALEMKTFENRVCEYF